MKLKKFISLSFTVLITASCFAQTPQTLVKIEDENYSIEEFDFIYNKNNEYTQEPKSRKEYIELFVNYKLKVHEAVAQGLDTLPSFTKEFNYYKDELAKPYLSDKKVTESLIQEAYDRLTQEVNASHILIKLAPSPSPEDTLKAYNKISSIIEEYNNGADFNELAKKYSEDPSAKQNGGKLGFFSGFMMVYPFESAAFNTEVNQISPITRTAFGYHVLKVHEKRANRGELRTAHIMQMFPPNSPADIVKNKRAKIDSIYQLVLRGDDFGALAKQYSEDRNSANKEGELPWFGTGRMIPEYSEPAFELDSVNNISTVIQTPYGFHIIKLLEKRGVKPFDEMKEEITNRISKDERAYQGKKVVITRLKKEYSYQENTETIDDLKAIVKDNSLSNDQLFENLSKEDKVLASMNGWEYKTVDLVDALKENRQFTQNKRGSLIDKQITSILEEEILAFEKSKLEEKYPEYKYLLSEYHDGLLIFEISQKEIWNKAIQDSTGISNYYSAHKSDYFFPAKLDGKVFFTNDKKELTAAKKVITANKEITTDSLKQLYPNAKVMEGVFEQGEYKAVDKQIWKIKKSQGKIDDDFKYLWAFGELIAAKQKELEETRGQVIADYQTQIEKEWLKQLNSKYAPVVNTKALKHSKK
ncbi:peptidylprolyl isomerase [Labilibacter marinus]|uniref:peptidylprolyl isomerase n=1 Tax=Labilibacter marinus TaxID=1477105 RepID=UPI000835E15F|nr:peptidylprolyl isomerase [Labilibacter marinus]